MKLTRVFGPTVNEYARADVQRPLRPRAATKSCRCRFRLAMRGQPFSSFSTRSAPLTQALGVHSRSSSKLAPFSTYTAILSFIACDIVGDAKVPFGNSRISSLRNRLTSIGWTL